MSIKRQKKLFELEKCQEKFLIWKKLTVENIIKKNANKVIKFAKILGKALNNEIMLDLTVLIEKMAEKVLNLNIFGTKNDQNQ